MKNVTNHFIFICQSTAERVAVAILSIYKGFLQILAFFLAICIPRIKVKGLNDAKYIMAAVYVSSLGLLLSTLTHFTLTGYINVHTGLFAIALLFSGTAILGLLFIPKVCHTYHRRRNHGGSGGWCPHYRYILEPALRLITYIRSMCTEPPL